MTHTERQERTDLMHAREDADMAAERFKEYTPREAAPRTIDVNPLEYAAMDAVVREARNPDSILLETTLKVLDDVRSGDIAPPRNTSKGEGDG
jgi:hypothetical protein